MADVSIPFVNFKADNIINANGGTVQDFMDEPVVAGDVDIKKTGADVLPIAQADNTSVTAFSTLNAYNGTGVATRGAPRIFYGTLPSQNDDSAICIGRDVRGTALFSHAYRDESQVRIEANGAYTGFDARFTIMDNVDASKYNHSYCFQASHEFASAGGIDLFAGHLSNLRVSKGTVDRLNHFHAQALTVSGTGVVSNHIGFMCDTLAGGQGTNWAFFAQTNDSFFGGNVQIGPGKDIFNFRQLKGGIGHFTNQGLVEFVAAGGVIVAGTGTAAGYAQVRAYSNDAGATRGLSLNPTGGQVLIGAGVPTTGRDLEVVGTMSASKPIQYPSYTVAALPTDNNVAAGSTAYASNARNAGEGVGAGTGSLVTYDGAVWKIPGIAGAVTA